MPTLLLLVVAQATPICVVEPDFSTVEVPASVARAGAERLAAELSARGVAVVTRRNLERQVGQDGANALFACGGAAATCLAQLAGAAGANAVILGDVSRLGERARVTLRAMHGRTGQVVATESEAFASDEELGAALATATERLVPALSHALDAPLAAVAIASPPLEHRWPRLWLSVATALVVTGAVLDMIAASAYEQLVLPTETPLRAARDADGVKLRGQVTMITSWVSYGLAAGALAWSTVLYLRGEPPPVRATVLVFSGGGALGVAGAFP